MFVSYCNKIQQNNFLFDCPLLGQMSLYPKNGQIWKINVMRLIKLISYSTYLCTAKYLFLMAFAGGFSIGQTREFLDA